METKQWWRQVDSLYNFIMQCTRKDKAGSPTEISGTLADNDVIAGFSASSSCFERGRMDSLCFSIASYKEISPIEHIVKEGIRRFGGYETRMDVVFNYGEVWRRTIRTLCPAELNIFGFPRAYKVKQINGGDSKEKLIAKAYGGKAFTPEIAADMYADAMGRYHYEIIESTKSRHGLFKITFNGATGRNRVRIERKESMLSRLNQHNINEVGEFFASTGYAFKGKEWQVSLLYGCEK